VDAKILRIIQHPSYKAPKKDFDIALFELETEIDFTEKVQPACLYTGPDHLLVGMIATLTGWGVVETGIDKKIL
jgi:hypothetical protein